MQLLLDKINDEGTVKEGNILKVDSFLNHQIDVEFMNKIGERFKELFKDYKIDKILTIEASGIAIACITAQYFKVPVVFAKKTSSKNLDADTYESEVYSFTKDLTYKIRVSKKYINEGENILVLDDFLANGRAVLGLQEIILSAKANLVGAGIVIEKGFQDGGKLLRSKGIKVESLAIVKSMENGKVIFDEGEVSYV